MRDESLYSTSTQKQSFDSMSYSDTRTTVMKLPQLDSVHSFDSDYEKETINQMDGGDFMLGTVSNQSLTGTRFSFNPAGSGGADAEHLYSTNGTASVLSEDDRFNVTYNRNGGDLKISVIPENDVVAYKSSGGATVNTESSIVKWFHSVFKFGRHNSRNYGYHSPPLPDQRETVTAKKMIFQLDNEADDNNVNRVVGETATIDGDVGIISGSSLKEADKFALEDELTAYMAELRLREER